MPAIKPVNWGPLNDQLNMGLNQDTVSVDYRVSLQNRALTRSFFYYQPDRFETGGRAQLLDPNPFFNNWYLTDVFYKNDLDSITSNYVEDRPATNVSALLESPNNFAGEKFWLDWYATKAAVFYPYSYLYKTISNYSARPALFSMREIPTSYGVPEVIVTPAKPSSIFVATNATRVGFYSSAGNSQTEYNSFISILSKLGLNTRFVVPLYLQSVEGALTVPVDTLVTDSYTYSQHGLEMATMLKTSNIVVIASQDGQPGLQPRVEQQGSRQLIDVPLSFSQLMEGREVGAYYFANSTRIIDIESINASTSTYYRPNTMSIVPNAWVPTFRTPNAQGFLRNDLNTVILNITSGDTSVGSEFNIQSLLPGLVPLSKDLTVSFSVQASADISLGIIFVSSTGCCPNYVAVDRKVNSGDPVQFQIPFSQFYKWGDSSRMFGTTQDLTFAINLPSGEPNVVVRFANVSVASPSYTVSTLARAISLSDNGILEYDSPGATGVALMNRSNSSTAVFNLATYSRSSITTLASLSGGQADELYDRILTVGENGQIAPIVGLLPESPWSPVHEEWTNNENMVAASIPQGFRGLVWKETYSPLWQFKSSSPAPTSSLSFYYAGPGMIYIPTGNYTGGIRASFMSIGFDSAILFSIPFVTVAALVLLRKRLQGFGVVDRNPVRN